MALFHLQQNIYKCILEPLETKFYYFFQFTRISVVIYIIVKIIVHHIRYHLIISSASILMFNKIQLNVTCRVQQYKWDNLKLNSIRNLCATIIYVIQDIYVTSL